MRFLILSYLTAEKFAPSNSWRHIDGVKEQQEYVKYLSVLCSVQFIPHRKHANAGRPSSHTMPLSLLAFRCSGTLRTCWHDVVTLLFLALCVCLVFSAAVSKDQTQTTLTGIKPRSGASCSKRGHACRKEEEEGEEGAEWGEDKDGATFFYLCGCNRAKSW